MTDREEADMYNAIREATNASIALIKFLKAQDKRIVDLEFEVKELNHINAIRDST